MATSGIVIDALRAAREVEGFGTDIAANGTIAVELWCNRVEGQVVVAGDTITVVVGQPTERSCKPEQPAPKTRRP